MGPKWSKKSCSITVPDFHTYIYIDSANSCAIFMQKMWKKKCSKNSVFWYPIWAMGLHHQNGQGKSGFWIILIFKLICLDFPHCCFATFSFRFCITNICKQNKKYQLVLILLSAYMHDFWGLEKHLVCIRNTCRRFVGHFIEIIPTQNISTPTKKTL